MKQKQFFSDQVRLRETFLRRKEQYKTKKGAMEMKDKEVPKLLNETNEKNIINELLASVKPHTDKTLTINHYAFIIGYPRCKACLGNWLEQNVSIRGVNLQGIEVRYSDYRGRTMVDIVPINNVFPYEDVNVRLVQLEDDPTIKYKEALFNVDDIVYVKPDREFTPGQNYPAIGSDYETDAKIHEVITTHYTKQHLYKLFSPTLSSVVLPEHVLVKPKDKLKYIYSDFMRARLAVDLSPFFKFGEAVYVYNNTVRNTIDTVIVPLTKELKDNLLIEQE